MEIIYKDCVLELLEQILKQKIKDVEFEETKEYYTIAEYNFSLQKAKIFYSDGRQEEIYIKMIKGGKIKESIFCYWSLLYEEFLNNNLEAENAEKKAIITQVTSDNSSSCILLTINSKLNYCAEINLIELKKFFEKNNKYERWLDEIGIKKEDILFIGKKMY